MRIPSPHAAVSLALSLLAVAACGDGTQQSATAAGKCGPDQCEIDGACLDEGAPNPDNPCQACRVARAKGAFSDEVGTACDDGVSCTVSDSCNAGRCAGVPPPQCDDGNACTTDSCDPATGCAQATVQSFGCRPRITVTSPLRAETVTGALPASVPVTGQVTSDAGPITKLTINGATVAVDPATGAFSYDMSARIGSNTMLIEAVDTLGTTDRVVQSYHWSTAYTLPTGQPGVGAVDPGLGIWLDQVTVDDGLPPPPTDLAEIFRGVLAGLDLNTFIDPRYPAAGAQPIASTTGYDIYVTALRKTGATTTLSAVDGGLHVTASLAGVNGDLFFDCTTWACVLAGGDSSGSLDINSVVIDSDLLISALPDHTLQVDVVNTTTTVNGLDVGSNNGWTNFLVSIIFPIVRDGIVTDIENDLNSKITSVLGPMVADGLSALAINQTFELPRLDGSTPPVSVNLASDFSFTTFQGATPGPPGGAIGLRAWASAVTRGVAAGSPFDDNDGVPMRVGCGTPPQALVFPRAAPLEIVFPDDTMNQILRGAWWGGLLEFPIDPASLGGLDLTAYSVTNLQMVVSGWLPPLASDCNPTGDLRLYVADLRIDMSMELVGLPLDAVVWVAFEAPIRLGASAATGQIEIVVSSVENVQVEAHVVQESMLAVQPVLLSLLEAQLVPALGSLLGGGKPLAGFPLPEMDLSAALGQPAGTSVVRIEPLSTPPAPERQGGNTIIYGSLK